MMQNPDALNDLAASAGVSQEQMDELKGNL